MATSKRIEVIALFSIKSKWQRIRFFTRHASIHAAVIDQAKELGADSWDSSQAGMKIGGRVVLGNPTEFC